MVNLSHTSPLVSITLLGGFTLRVGGKEMTSIPRKARALLAYLAMQDGKPVSRETMSDLLWTDRGVEQARHSLRQTLLVLRRELRDAGEDLIRSEDGVLSFRPEAVATDVGRFRVLAGSRDRADLAEAAELYAGPLLARFQPVAADFDDWVDRSRGEVEEISLDVLGRLADSCMAAGDAHAAVPTTERMLAVDPLREDVHRRLIEAYARVGRRADAIRQYNTCVEMLRRELDVGPSAETEALIGRVRGIEGKAMPVDQQKHSLDVVTLSPRYPQILPWLAVLPFRALGPSSVPDYVQTGFCDDLVCMLATFRDPVVLSSHSTMAYRGQDPDPRVVGRDLNVRYVVVGSIRKHRDASRINVELVAAESGSVIWSHIYDIDDRDLFDTQDAIVAQIVSSLIPRVDEMELRRSRAKRPDDLTAYELRLRARELILQLDRAHFEEAGGLLRRAATMDPHYASVQTLLAEWHTLRVGQGWSPDPADDIRAVESASRAAIAADSNHARALASYGHYRSYLNRDYGGALNLFDRALNAAPNDSIVWKWSSSTYSYIDEGDEAVRRAERALELSPRDPFIFGIYSSLCLAHYTRGDYEQAVHWGRLSQRANSHYTSNSRFLTAALVADGHSQEARAVARTIVDQDPMFSVRQTVARHPFQDADKRLLLGLRLLEAGLPA